MPNTVNPANSESVVEKGCIAIMFFLEQGRLKIRKFIVR